MRLPLPHVSLLPLRCCRELARDSEGAERTRWPTAYQRPSCTSSDFVYPEFPVLAQARCVMRPTLRRV